MLDNIDRKLIEILEQDAHQSSESISTQLNISPSTIRRRIGKLIDRKLIRIVAAADAGKLGYPITIVISLNAAHDTMGKAVKKLVSKQEIIWLANTTGKFNIIAIARFPSTNDFFNFMQTLLAENTFISSETFICLSIDKGHWKPNI